MQAGDTPPLALLLCLPVFRASLLLRTRPLTILRRAKEKGTLCLDGSTPGYHLQRGSGTGSESLLIHLEVRTFFNIGADFDVNRAQPSLDNASFNLIDAQLRLDNATFPNLKYRYQNLH